MSSWFRSTFETVTTDTPRSRAMSFIVVGIDFHIIMVTVKYVIPESLTAVYRNWALLRMSGRAGLKRRQAALDPGRRKSICRWPSWKTLIWDCSGSGRLNTRFLVLGNLKCAGTRK